MSVFVDTSALFVLLDRDNAAHPRAADAFRDLLRADQLITHNYVVLETTALVGRRLGLEGVRILLRDLVPNLEVVWIDEATHAAAVSALLASSARDVSLVDRVSFQVMRERDVASAFAFDSDFVNEGFETVP